jgi:hypothetical protein
MKICREARIREDRLARLPGEILGFGVASYPSEALPSKCYYYQTPEDVSAREIVAHFSPEGIPEDPQLQAPPGQ